MTYKDLLDHYNERRKCLINRFIRVDEVTKEELWGALHDNWNWFCMLRRECDDFSVTTLLPDSKDYCLIEGNDDVYRIIDYRNFYIPVYVDDYGQNLYVKIGDKCFAGVNWSTDLREILDQIDYEFDCEEYEKAIIAKQNK